MLSCVSHFIDIRSVAIKNIRNMHAVSTNQIADIVHFNRILKVTLAFFCKKVAFNV